MTYGSESECATHYTTAIHTSLCGLRRENITLTTDVRVSNYSAIGKRLYVDIVDNNIQNCMIFGIVVC